MREYMRTYKNIGNKNKKLDYKPQIINLELTNACSLDCMGCPRRQMSRKVGYMSEEVVKQVKNHSISDFVWLHHFGDPVLHERFDDFSIIADGNGIKTGISIKGNTLNEKRRNKLKNSKISKVLFSWADTNKENFEKFQKNIDYKKTMQNVKKYLKIKPKNQKVVLQLLLYDKKSEEEKKSFRRQWKELANEIEFKECHTWTGDEEKINKTIETEGEKNLNPCPDIWREMAILYNGDVVPCCRDFEGKYVIGNIMESNLYEIWNSEKMARLRSFHLKGKREKIKLCRNCKNSMTPLLRRAIEKIKDIW